MVQAVEKFLESMVGYLWGLPTVVLLVGGGIYFTLMLGLIQIRGLGHAVNVVKGKYDDPNDPGEISHFNALCTALSATVGLGNIAGVAVAIKMGGPGATFWMVLAGLIGMATKYSECTLAVMYREVDSNGRVLGGPMYYIEKGLGPAFKPLAMFFSVCCVFAAFGAANMFQSNQVAAIMTSSFGIDPIITGLVLAVLTGVVIIGGIKRIGAVAGKLVPLMGLSYVVACLAILLMFLDDVPNAIGQIFSGAFSGTAATGGFAGAVVAEVLKQGVRRAAFSNEAGIGSAPIAHAAAKTDEAVREGVVALLEPLIDTVLICTMTALVIGVTGVWTGPLTGVELTAAALDAGVPGLGSYFIPIAVSLFAYSTMISWSYYGEQSINYIFGEKGIIPYKMVFCLAIVVGAVWKISPVLNFSDSMLALMIIPNMLAIILLTPKLKEETKSYFKKLDSGDFDRS